MEKETIIRTGVVGTTKWTYTAIVDKNRERGNPKEKMEKELIRLEKMLSDTQLKIEKIKEQLSKYEVS